MGKIMACGRLPLVHIILGRLPLVPIILGYLPLVYIILGHYRHDFTKNNDPGTYNEELCIEEFFAFDNNIYIIVLLEME